MAAKLNTFGTISDDATTYHNDYGIPAVSMILESGGQDLVALVNGYNWFNTSQNYSDRVYDSSSDELIWKTFYNHLKAANNVLKLIAADTEDSSLKVYRGQALGRIDQTDVLDGAAHVAGLDEIVVLERPREQDGDAAHGV